MILLELRNKGLLSIYYSISQLWTLELLLHYNLRSLLHCMVDLLSIKVGHALLWRHESKFLSIYYIKMCTNAAGLQRSVLLIIIEFTGTGWLMYTSEVYLDESLIFFTTLIKSVLLQQETGKLYIFCAWLHEWCLLMDPVFLHNPCYAKLYSSNQTRRTKYLKFSSIIKQERFILSSTQIILKLYSQTNDKVFFKNS